MRAVDILVGLAVLGGWTYLVGRVFTSARRKSAAVKAHHDPWSVEACPNEDGSSDIYFTRGDGEFEERKLYRALIASDEVDVQMVEARVLAESYNRKGL